MAEVGRHLQKIDSFLRLIRWYSPIGTGLLLSPTLSALWMASAGTPSFKLQVIFILGTFLLRSAGCAINDAIDFRVDKFVLRTQNRPIVSGKITVLEAWIFAGILLLLGFLLVLFTNPATIFMAVLAVPILIVYPFAKRWMHCPQAILGLAFSFGILMAYSSILGEHVSWWKIFMSLPPTAWLLFMANFAWILAYDTIYALVDIEDDKKIGIRTSAIFFGRMVRSVIGVFYLIYLILSAWILLQFNNSFLSWIVLGLMGWQIVNFWLKIKSLDRLICLQVFSQNYRLGWLFFAGVILQKTSMLNHIG